MNQRASGILLHLTSLSNPHPIGDLGILHTDYRSTCAKLGAFGLPNEGAQHETR